METSGGLDRVAALLSVPVLLVSESGITLPELSWEAVRSAGSTALGAALLARWVEESESDESADVSEDEATSRFANYV